MPELLRARGVTPELAQYARLVREALEHADAQHKASAAKSAKRSSRSAR